MLTQEDFVAKNMSAERSLQRSSWKAEAIRRGDLKISGPFPITEETPLNDEEEMAYAEHTNSNSPTAIATKTTGEAPRPVTPTQKSHQRPSSIHDGNSTLHPTVESVEVQSATRDDEQDSSHKRSPAGVREMSETTQRQSSAEPVPYSTPSPFPSIPESSTKTTPQKKKRKSGLRNVFRKMFGKKSRDEPIQEDDSARRHTYHKSDPVVLSGSPKRQQESATGPRISDLPVHDLQPVNPLGQHLPFPMNVNAPQETSPQHDYLTFDLPSPAQGRRRATLPSVLLAHSDAQSLPGVVHGSFDRLPAWDENDGQSIPSPQIGIALSSPPPGGAQSVQSKRRSRSAGALRDLAKGRPSIERRRSAEIRYWRNSYQSGSIYSTATRPQTARTVETVRSIETLDTVAQAPESVAETRNTTQHLPVAQHDQDVSQIPLSVEHFNFGNLKSEFSADEQEEEEVLPGPELERGREHEPEPEIPPRSIHRQSVEERVHHLEANVRDLETSIRRISGRTNRQTIILENAPKGRRSRNRSSSATSDRQGSHHSSKGSHTTISRVDYSSPPSPTLAPLSAVDEFPSSRSDPQTIISEPSIHPRPSTHHGYSASIDHLTAALHHERSARKALEHQVNSLQREFHDLHALVTKFLTTSPSYPTPSPDTIMTSNEERMTTPRAHAERGLGFDSAERGIRQTRISRFSNDGSEAGNDSLGSSREDVTSPETWMTPKEESGFGNGSGFFGRSRSQLELGGMKARKGNGEDEMF
ncbi:hypothetical protein B0J11DRAFT_220510 [Dendryphion nanum]|uniref:Uncharacterized protein n=1 Tax=Dendryphion nanum TaxID=256645 RepID=A0A9P9IT03_9PLEO|nr:hypothetical protein B0J11DRAFT_220510 [Dendryphion nanum]